MEINIAEIRGAVARGWCHDKNSAKVMDTDLAEAISQEVHSLFIADRNPYLGCATTKQLIEELAARADIAESVGKKWPLYTTVGS